MTQTHADYRLSQLDQLEAESIHIFREVAAEFEKPVLMFSGGKDSIVMLRLAEKAFYPAKIPFPVLQVDTGYDFPEVLETRDNWVNRLGVKLIVASVEEALANGIVVDDGKTSRNRHQIGTLLNAIEENGFTAAFGGGRRDEEKARAKERVYSHRDDFGQWDPKMQRPELWSLYNGRIHGGEHMRIFPLSNWTELDIWHYLAQEEVEIPSIYFSHQRRVFKRDGMWLSESEFNPTKSGETVEEKTVRFRTVGDLTLTGCVESEADTLRQDHRGGRHRPGHRARRHPRRRPVLRGRHGGPQEGRLLLMTDPDSTPATEVLGQMDLLRFATAGSVDDGKSTLIGRLLLDSKAIFEDQLEAVEATSQSKGYDYTDLALLTDGLRSEREQGITIDVAYRYFATPRRKFIIADTPGHVQYTRNMVTGASTADLGLVLVDARQGLTEQSRRHAVILSLLRVPHLVLAVNKMDLVDYDQAVYDRIHKEFTSFATKLNIPDLEVIPISALNGDNVVNRSDNMPWYNGSSLMHHLENVHVASDRDLVDTRLPVQYVVRPKSDQFHDYRGYAGQVAGGVLKPGDEVVVLPERDDQHHRRHRPLREGDRRGLPAHVGHRAPRGRRRRQPRRHDRPRQERPQAQPGHRRDDLLDDQRAAAPPPEAGDQAHHPLRSGADQGHPVPPGRQLAAPRPGDQGARPQRDRPRPAAHHRAAAVRPLLEEPDDRVVHPDRRGHRRHRRRRDDQQRAAERHRL